LVFHSSTVIILIGATGCHSLHWLAYQNNVTHSANCLRAWQEVINDSCQTNIQTLYFCSRHWRFHQVVSIYILVCHQWETKSCWELSSSMILRSIWWVNLSVPKHLQIIITIHCVIPQKSMQLIHFVAEAWNHIQAVEVAYDIILYDNS